MRNIKHMLDVVDKVRDNVALALMSDPGLSKTSQVKQWAEENGRQYCELIISQRMPSEISGMPMPVPDTQKMEIFDFDTLLKLKDGDVLAFDEFTNGNIQTLNACLTLIQERTMLSGKKLPSLVIVAMGNPQGRCDLLPQTKQRFLWVEVRWDQKVWGEYIKQKWGFEPAKYLYTAIAAQYREGFGKRDQDNYITPRTVENLIRIAQNVPRTDPFWNALELDVQLIDAVYESLGKKSKLAMIKDQILEWTSTIDEKTVDMNTVAIVELGIKEASTMKELRAVIAALEKENVLPELFEYLNGTELNDE